MRRSEWPTITHWHQPRSIAGDTSPVYAPDCSQKQSWAPSWTPEPSVTSATPRSHGKGGNSATSTLSVEALTAGRTPRTRSTASPPSTGFIFQLAAIRAFSVACCGNLRLTQNGDARQLLALEVLEGRAASGGDVRVPSGKTQRVDGGSGVASADESVGA